MKQIDTRRLQAAICKNGLTPREVQKKCGLGDSTMAGIFSRGYCRETTACKLVNALGTCSFVLPYDAPRQTRPESEKFTVNINSAVLASAKAAFTGSRKAFQEQTGVDFASVKNAIEYGRCKYWTAKAIAKGLGIPLESFVLDDSPEQIEIAESVDEPDEAAAEPEAGQVEEPEAAPTDKEKALGEKIWDRIFEAHLQGYAEQRNVEYKRLTDIFYEDAEPTLAEAIAIAKCAGWSLDEMLRGATPLGQQKTISELLLIVIFDQIKTLISNRSGITKERLGIIFDGDEDPTIAEVVAISDAVGLSLDELLKGV